MVNADVIIQVSFLDLNLLINVRMAEKTVLKSVFISTSYSRILKL